MRVTFCPETGKLLGFPDMQIAFLWYRMHVQSGARKVMFYGISCINIRNPILAALALTEGHCISRQNKPSGFVLRCP